MAGLATTNELWYTVYYWLKTYGSKPNKNFCKQELTTHPDYPALTSVTDFLEMGGMTCSALQADASYIHEFNYPLLAHIKQPGIEQIHIINKARDWNAEKEITQHWTGVVIFAGRNARWQHAENDAHVKKQSRSRQNSYLLAAAALAFLFISIFRTPVISFALMAFLSLAGLVISILITGTELGVQSNLVKQVCGAVSNGGCERVLKTDYAKGIAGFSTGDIAIIYFSTQFLLLLASAYFPLTFNTILMISLAGLLVAGWSIYTQAILIKQWCALCIGVVAVMFIQFTIAVLVIDFRLPIFSLSSAAIFIGLAVFIAMLLYPVKQVSKTNYANEQKLAELKKWKMDGEIFMTQWQKEQEVDPTIWDNDVIFGCSDAPIRIIVACNPYCQPCAVAHEKLEEILVRNPQKLCVLVRFLCDPNDENDRRTIFVKSYLQIRKSIIKTESELALSEWFKVMDYSKWVKTWKPTSNINVQDELQKHSSWVKDNRMHIPVKVSHHSGESEPAGEERILKI